MCRKEGWDIWSVGKIALKCVTKSAHKLNAIRLCQLCTSVQNYGVVHADMFAVAVLPSAASSRLDWHPGYFDCLLELKEFNVRDIRAGQTGTSEIDRTIGSPQTRCRSSAWFSRNRFRLVATATKAAIAVPDVRALDAVASRAVATRAATLLAGSSQVHND